MTVSLSRVDVIPYALPFATTYATARGRLARRELVLLRAVDRDGTWGIGEGVPLTLRGGIGLERTVAELDRWAELAPERGPLDWRTGNPSPGSDGPPDPASLSPPARIAILTALADLEARRRRVPLWAILGARSSLPVPCNATLVSAAPSDVAADARRWAERGFTTFKLKLGLDPEPLPAGATDRDLAQVAAVRGAVGSGARIRLDANGAWTLERALQAIQAAAEHGIELVEQPVEGLEQMARVRAALDGIVALAADESVDSPAAARRAVELGACDMATVKLSKTGTLDPVLDLRLPVYLSSALDGPVGIAAAAHAFQVLRERDRDAMSMAHGLATQELFAAKVATRSCELHESRLELPDGPGLGLELDDDALARYATRSLPG